MTDTLQQYYSGQLYKQASTALQKTAISSRGIGTTAGTILGATIGYGRSKPTTASMVGNSMLGSIVGGSVGGFAGELYDAMRGNYKKTPLKDAIKEENPNPIQPPQPTQSEVNMEQLKRWFSNLTPEKQDIFLRTLRVNNMPRMLLVDM